MLILFGGENLAVDIEVVKCVTTWCKCNRIITCSAIEDRDGDICQQCRTYQLYYQYAATLSGKSVNIMYHSIKHNIDQYWHAQRFKPDFQFAVLSQNSSPDCLCVSVWVDIRGGAMRVVLFGVALTWKWNGKWKYLENIWFQHTYPQGSRCCWCYHVCARGHVCVDWWTAEYYCCILSAKSSDWKAMFSGPNWYPSFVLAFSILWILLMAINFPAFVFGLSTAWVNNSWSDRTWSFRIAPSSGHTKIYIL